MNSRDGVYLNGHQLPDAKVVELMDSLINQPDTVSQVFLAHNKFTDATGCKLAQYVARSSTVKRLILSYNDFSETTYLAMATALCVNSSLKELHMQTEEVIDQVLVDRAFVVALRLNSTRSSKTHWQLYTQHYDSLDFKRLKNAADKNTQPSMLEFVLHIHST